MVMLRRRGSDACLVVVGAPLVGGKQWAEDLEARARAELDDRVRFLGPRSDPERVFRALDVLVNASRHEAFGRTVLEAQASGVAVVGTNAGGIPEFVEDGETGLLVPPRAPAPLADAIERVLGDEELRVMLCERGRAQAEKRFRLDAEAEQIAEVYRVALGEQP
jgi:glycosyltransferase involved in cell wall biosynthesis